MNDTRCQDDTHPDINSLVAFVNGRLRVAEAEVIESHLEVCSDCWQKLASASEHQDRFLAQLVSAVRSAAAESAVRLSGQRIPSGVDARAATVTLHDVPANVGRYQIRSVIGQGAFGIVLRGYDPRLRREAAVKIPRLGTHLTAELRDRFIREAQAAAALDHPGIVPIYDAGRDAEVCYIAAHCCDGPDLARWLKNRREPAPVILAAEMVAQLARATQHAHDRGILHRDLKPSNIILDSRAHTPGDGLLIDGHGCTARITDFGLAKIVDSEDLTHSNVVMGTAAYLSPEQAGGRSREIGPLADVYALGVVLYELLTGRPPLVGESDLETIQLVLREEPLAPIRLRPKLSRDLDTVCLKCLMKQPRERYASAAALAEDLERYLRGEPISARPLSLATRLARLSRRQPAIVGLASLVGVTVVCAIIGLSALWLQAENSKVAVQRNAQAAEANLRLAERNLDFARQAVDDCFLAATDNELMWPDEMLPVKHMLLENVLRYYLDFVERSGDLEVTAELATLWFRIGETQTHLGRPRESQAAYEEALRLMAPLASEPLADSDRRFRLAAIYNNLALRRRALGELNGALEFAHAAREIREKLVEENPHDWKFKWHLCHSYNNLGLLHRDCNERSQARSWLFKAYELQSTVVGQRPQAVLARADLVRHCLNLSEEHLTSGELQQALDYLTEAEQTCRPLVIDNPKVGHYRLLLGQIQQGMAAVHRRRQQSDQAINALTLAKDAFGQLVDSNSRAPEYQARLAVVHRQMSELLSGAGQLALALDESELACRLHSTLLENDSKNAMCSHELARSLHTKANVLARLRRGEEAIQAFRSATEFQQEALQLAPGNRIFRKYLAFHMRGWSLQLGEMQRWDEAVMLAHQRGDLYPADPEQLLLIAEDIAWCLSELQKQASDSSAKPPADRHSLEDMAIGAVRDAVSHGFRDAERLRQRRFDPLLAREAFQRLRAQISADPPRN